MARYKIIEKYLDNESIFLSGHHQQDQAETFLLQLMRGAGLDGLKSMPEIKELGKGLYFRPFLNTPKTVINSYAKQNKLDYIEDDSNYDTRFARNFIRKEVLPILRTRWENVDASISKSAKWLSEVEENILSVDNLIIKELNQKSFIIQKQEVRSFFKSKTGKQLNEKQLNYILTIFLTANHDKNPELDFYEWVIRRFDGQIIITKSILDLPDNLINLTAEVGVDKIIFDSFNLVWQEGRGLDKKTFKTLEIRKVNLKDRFQPHNRQKSQKIKKLFLEYKIPYWLRSNHFGLFHLDELVALPNIGVAKKHFVESESSFFPELVIDYKI